VWQRSEANCTLEDDGNHSLIRPLASGWVVQATAGCGPLWSYKQLRRCAIHGAIRKLAFHFASFSARLLLAWAGETIGSLDVPRDRGLMLLNIGAVRSTTGHDGLEAAMDVYP